MDPKVGVIIIFLKIYFYHRQINERQAEEIICRFDLFGYNAKFLNAKSVEHNISKELIYNALS